MLVLKEILSDRNISISPLQRMMEEKGYRLSRNSISNIINNVHSPKVETLAQIADTLFIDIRDLFAGKQTGENIYIKDKEGSFKKIGTLNLNNE